jgi:hypothetical protein
LLLFHGQRLDDFLTQRKQALEREVDALDRDYLLNASETDLVAYLVDKYTLEPPIIAREDTHVADQSEVDVDVRDDPRRLVFDRSGPALVKGTAVTIAVPFTGSGELFRYQPSTFTLGTRPDGVVATNEVRLTYNVLDHNQDELREASERDLRTITEFLGWLASDLSTFTASLPGQAHQLVQARKRRLLADSDLAASLGIPIKQRGSESQTYSPPEIRRKVRIQRPEAPRGQFAREPALADEDFEHILTVLEKMATVIERSPKAFAAMGEEDIRWHFLVQLNGHYETPGTGETFNADGKTDILLLYDGKNVFIAECKFWDGPKKLLEAFDQFLGYLSWRDTKVALLIFNRGRNHTAVVEKVGQTVLQHPNFKRELARRGETHLRYLFHQPGDRNREVHLAVLIFDVPAGAGDAERARAANADGGPENESR